MAKSVIEARHTDALDAETQQRSALNSSEPLIKETPRDTSRDDEDLIYVNAVAAAIHESALGLAAIGEFSPDKMREFDDSCLKKTPAFSPAKLKKLRERENVSQSVLAHYLGVSVNTVSQWERGERKATGTAAKLLSLVQKHGLNYIR